MLQIAFPAATVAGLAWISFRAREAYLQALRAGRKPSGWIGFLSGLSRAVAGPRVPARYRYPRR